MVTRSMRQLPDWARVLMVVAHPDDETFGLGALVDRLTAARASVHLLCFTHGEASTLNSGGADLRRARAQELELASSELGVAGVTLLDYRDGHLAEVPGAELAGHVTRLAGGCQADGLLVFDDNGITGHADHRAATAAAVTAAVPAGLPVLAWVLTSPVADRMRAETGQPFAGQPPDRIDLCIRVSRARQRRAALLHASQISAGAAVWRRLQLQGDCEHLRWLRPPGGPGGRAGGGLVVTGHDSGNGAAAGPAGGHHDGKARSLPATGFEREGMPDAAGGD